jgi:hypothetical protein
MNNWKQYNQNFEQESDLASIDSTFFSKPKKIKRGKPKWREIEIIQESYQLQRELLDLKNHL